MTRRDSALLVDGDSVFFLDRKGREYLKTIRAGKTISIRGGRIEVDSLIGRPEGSRVEMTSGETFLVFRPTYATLIPNLPRQAQVIYPKDTGPILVWGDIYPGATVLEAGVGPGALTIALLRAVGPSGRVISIEAREDFIEMARENVTRFFGAAPNWTLRQGDVYEAIDEPGIDRMILDVPEPWRALEHAARALRPGGVLVGYIPTTLQLKELADALGQHPGFAPPEMFETFLRHWETSGRSLRPAHRMVAHTAFICVTRRLAD